MAADANKQRLTDLTERLAAATTARAARWQLEGDDVFVWSAADGVVTVGSRDHDGEPPYELAVYNPARERVDELASDLLEDDQPASWNDALGDLYRAARRSALRADDIIDALIEALPGPDGSNEQHERSFLRGWKSATPSAADS
jgi:hypothetical protein